MDGKWLWSIFAVVESWLEGGMNDGQDRTRTVIARTRGFLSDGRKEDDGADKSAANLTRPFRFVGLWLSRGWNVVVGWLGKWLWSSFIVVEKQLDGRGGKADEEKSGRGKEQTRRKKRGKTAAPCCCNGISPSCQPRRSSPPVEPIDSSELTRSPPSADVSPVSSWRLGSPRSSSSSFSSPGRPDAGMP